jgi:molybdopterin-dependent oxidoreductase alpha subunit
MWKPSTWASLVPLGLGEQKPHHFISMARIAWANRDELPFAYRILTKGVCDGCALGTTGLHDWTMKGTHLCMVRLELLRLNTAPALDPDRLADVVSLRSLTSKELRDLGRLPEPMVRRAGDRGFRVIGWDEALDIAASHLVAVDPARAAFYLTSRGLTNESYYVAQKAARVYGSPHVDNSARLCHAASTVAMKKALGHGASTCSYADWIGADLIVFFGSNTPNNQPVTTKYLFDARKQGTEVAVVNPLREPGLERYWIPSIAESALFGTKLADHWFAVHTGGDLAFLVGTLKALVEKDQIDRTFVAEHTTGFQAAADAAGAASWTDIQTESGASRADIERFARLIVDRPNAIFVWSMGLTQHAHGVDTIRALLNVALARGLVGRPHRGLMPIRGHSGVQGGAEVGCTPVIDAAMRDRWSALWGVRIPDGPGLFADAMIAAAARGDTDVFWMVGGNFLETVGDPARTREALWRPRLRVHHDIVLSSSMLVDPSDTVLVLPATTRYEAPGGGTETSTERRIIFSPEIEGRRIGSARPEWWALGRAIARVRPAAAGQFEYADAGAIRAEIAHAIPLYTGIETLQRAGDQVQWGGPRLFDDGRFATADGRAQLAAVGLLGRRLEPGTFFVSTRRGKQFNSMVQRDTDPLTGAPRDAVLLSADDAAEIGAVNGTHLRLTSATGTFEGQAFIAPLHRGNLEVHWPEALGLLDAEVIDPASGEPDYNAIVRLEVIDSGTSLAFSSSRTHQVRTRSRRG